jgi:hypothetical protein
MPHGQQPLLAINERILDAILALDAKDFGGAGGDFE